MDIFGYQISVELTYNILAGVLSFLIIINYFISVYYGIKMIILKNQNRYGWCPEMLVTIESIVWLILFGYIFIFSVIGKPLILDSFGVIYIRPVIFISSCIRAILQRRRCLLYEQKLKHQRETKGG